MASLSGRILYVSSELQLKSIGYQILVSKDNGHSWERNVLIPSNKRKSIFCKSRWLQRLLRLGVYQALKYGDEFIVFADKCIYKLNTDSLKLTLLGNINGSRPLYSCIHNNNLYYGQYFSNVDRESVSIYKLDLILNSWDIIFRIKGIRHIHGIFNDPYFDRIWVTTGDLDHECKILYTDDEFKTLKTFVEGHQNYRAIYLHFAKETITYGTDAPDDQNYIYTVSRESAGIISKVPVDGPIFFGGLAGKTRILTTAVEPSKFNKTPYAELWISNNDQPFEKVIKLKKDLLAKKLFQYGQIWLPSGPGIDGLIFYSPLAVEQDNEVRLVNSGT